MRTIKLTIIEGYKEKPSRATDKALLSAFDTLKEPASSRQSLASEVEVGSTNGADKDTPHVKKRHRRMKSSGVKKDGDDEGENATSCEFTIVSLDGKRWRWEVCAGGGAAGAGAAAAAERDAWVAAVEAQILASLQGRSSANGSEIAARFPKSEVQRFDAGVQHKRLSYVNVMVCIGNELANAVWEAELRGHSRPQHNSPREDKERWIRLKYERGAFLPSDDMCVSGEMLRTAAARGKMAMLVRALASPPPRVPSPHDRSLALRAAAAAGQLAAAQLLIWAKELNFVNIKGAALNTQL
ncbi:Centaurin-gamma-1A [Papilio machaon]|uniref:Centaurin-gamma-1A n=1 Tax=Papilio machaon TaxID=76193 RepID=A0A0N1IBF9_PAPMA|nr:Centaurin-gamma-1A [Papilio machaon]